ncbi:MAG: ribosome silencing factor [Planctomycetes bacterium]|nr:ribosome silencing factor [Planctomycetota bacterium]
MADLKNIESKDFALAAGRIALELNCRDVMVVDLRGKSPATDFFVIATCTSGRQGRTVCDKIMEFGRENKIQRFGLAGYEQGKWVLVDFVDVVVHIFDDEYREYYELETLWGDAEIIEIAGGDLGND